MQSIEKLIQTILDLFVSPASTNRTGQATNAVVTITLAAKPGKSHRIKSLSWSYSAAPTGGAITVNDGANPVYRLDVTAAGPGFVPVNIKGSTGGVVTITLAAGGSAIVGKLNVQALAAV